eukprot:364100-Chlamydomonas_euryale.AAC.70
MHEVRACGHAPRACDTCMHDACTCRGSSRAGLVCHPRSPPPPGPLSGCSVPQEVIHTMRVLAEIPKDSLGAYVISMARTASDVLAVVLLQRECGVKDFLRVVPLFETLDDLTNAPQQMRTLLGNEWYRTHINGLQECMIGGWGRGGGDA